MSTNELFKPTGLGNELMKCDGFHVSYNASPCMGISMFSADEGSDETAIVAGGEFYILNGDFREEYAKLNGQPLSAFVAFFAAHPDRVSSWSASVEDALEAIGAQP